MGGQLSVDEELVYVDVLCCLMIPSSLFCLFYTLLKLVSIRLSTLLRSCTSSLACWMMLSKWLGSARRVGFLNPLFQRMPCLLHIWTLLWLMWGWIFSILWVEIHSLWGSEEWISAVPQTELHIYFFGCQNSGGMVQHARLVTFYSVWWGPAVQEWIRGFLGILSE